MNVKLSEKEIKLIERMLSDCAVKNGKLEIKPIIRENKVQEIAVYEILSRRIRE